MVNGSAILQTAVKIAVENEIHGMELLCKFTIPDIINRVKYKRRTTIDKKRPKELG